MKPTVKILAHRGYHRDCRENSYDAFAEAAALGVDGIETDVRASTDGIALLYHDRALPDQTPISSLTYDQICQKAGFEVPILENELKRWPDLIWNIEIKSADAVSLVRETLNKVTVRRERIVTSFWHSLISEFETDQKILKGVLVAHHPQSYDFFLKELRHLHGTKIIIWSYEIVTPSLLESASQEGFVNYLYDINDASEFEKILAMNIDALITDNPAVLLAARKQWLA